MMKPYNFEATRATDTYAAVVRLVSSRPLGPAMDLAPLNRGVLLLVGETATGRVCWVERAGMALDVRGPETEGALRSRRVPGDPRP